MRKGFTLVELLVVTLVIAILAGIVFRLRAEASDSEKLQVTLNKMQRLENCLSGYYAAFGSYPPVSLQAKLNPFIPVDEYDKQDPDVSPNYGSLDWRNVKAACKAMPVAAQFPPKDITDPKGLSDAIQALMETDSAYAEMFANAPAAKYPFDGYAQGNVGQAEKKHPPYIFGLLSYLLPRYRMMMGGETSRDAYYISEIWTTFNTLPCHYDTGLPYEDWMELDKEIGKDDTSWEVDLIPSQAVCQRWLPNLAGACYCDSQQREYYGIDIYDPSDAPQGRTLDYPKANKIKIYPSSSGWSKPDEITMHDGWGEELYYYSPPPYQSYRLWSAGPNGKTFPPWIPDEQIKAEYSEDWKRTIAEWVRDDVVHLSH